LASSKGSKGLGEVSEVAKGYSSVFTDSPDKKGRENREQPSKATPRVKMWADAREAAAS